MKPHLNAIAALALILVLLTSCERDNWHNIHGSGPVLSDERVVPPFYDVSVSIPGRVYLYQSNHPELTIKAQANILDAIETRVRNSKLEIGLFNKAGLGRHETIEIYISSAMYKNIQFSGAVDGRAETPLYVPDLSIFISGSGTFSGELYAQTLSVNISGTGKLWLSGEVKEQFLVISGAGNVYAFDLDSEAADIRISGSAEVEVAVDDYLYASISGSGTVFYWGNPDIESHISGSGKLVHVKPK